MKIKRKNTNGKMIGIIIISFSLLYIFSFIFLNKMGIFGKMIVDNMTRYLGIGSYLLPFLLLSLGIILFFEIKLISPYRKFFAIGFFRGKFGNC